MYIDNGLLIYCWKHKLFGIELSTTTGKNVYVIDCGLFDRRHGKRFFNAKIKVDGTLYVGNVLIVNMTSDFFTSFDDYKKDSNSVVLVICNVETQQCISSNGEVIPVIQAEIPEKVSSNADILMGVGGDNICHAHIMEYTTLLSRHAWFAAMQTEFIEEESDYLSRYYKECGNDLEETFFAALLRAFGFVANKIPMDFLARSISLSVLEHYRDDLFQIEAILMGQAGLLEVQPDVQCALPLKYKDAAMNEGYFQKLRNEYLYLAHKYSMSNISWLCWKPQGKGGLNYPHTYLSMLANLYYTRSISSGIVLETKTAKELMNRLNTHVTPYWETHFVFGDVSKKCMKSLSEDRKAWIVMAGIVPFLFFCGRLKQNEELCDRAFDFMEQVKTFQTSATNHFKKLGLKPMDAGESLALTYMKSEYCSAQCRQGDPRRCLQCRFGFEFIKKH